MTVKLLDEFLPMGTLFESPLWNEAEQCLYWVDIPEWRIYRRDHATGAYKFFSTPTSPGFVALSRHNILIVGLQDGLYEFDTQTGRFYFLSKPPDIDKKVRFNDGKPSPDGFLWAGTIPLPAWRGLPYAKLYRLNETFSIIAKDITNSNGLCWSPDGKTMYHADTGNSTIWQYKYKNGQASEKQPFHVFTKGERPDGLSADEEGNIYAALYGASRIDILSASGKTKDHIKVPVPNPTSCTFGGPDMKTLFITTSAENMSDHERDHYPFSGRMLTCETNQRGMPAYRYIPEEQRMAI